MERRSLIQISLLLFFSCLAIPCSRAEGSNPTPPLFQRVAIIGASVSAGFCSDEFLGGPRTPEYRLANYFSEALTCDHEPIVSRADKTFFTRAKESLEQQITETLEAKPSLVIGLDSLFWCCYGSRLSPAQRLELFEFGLKQLDRIEQPLVVGDLPDARHSIGKILSAEQVPSPEVLMKCNGRLKEWAAGKKNVALFPFATMMSAAVSRQPLELGGRTWDKDLAGTLLQRDLLHPSPLGLSAIAVGTLDAIGTIAVPPIPQTLYHRDLDAVTKGAVALGVKQSQERAAAEKRKAEQGAPVPAN
ncbi:MAG: hypothetical protein EOP88_11620 [Verrucomicrobiaceae bacterium]|nr:MAG: hypothetical protein EOP88_11620 [Verrucomicrobiaceae bacterium]